MARQLTEKQQAFLDALFNEAEGNPVKALKMAGYSQGMSTTTVMAPLKEHIAERTRDFIANNGPQAVWSMMQVMRSPTDLGNKEKMAAAKELLDRAGFSKVEKLEVKSQEPLFILPSKNED